MSPADPYSYLGFIRNADGSISRVADFLPAIAASSDPSNPVLTKDVPINHQNGTWARLYLPADPPPPPAKLPVVLYFHGSGFVVSSAASSIFQKFCSDIALETPAVLVSVEYRLAPEHRLPAAYDDCAEALGWLGAAAANDDEWLTAHADLSRCYVMGTSAGGNIAYHVGLREAASAAPLVRIKGLILHHPFFGGAEMTPSEIRLADDAVLPWRVAELMWGLSLPVGADRDHEYCNPMKKEVEVLEKMKEQDWKFLITGCDGDPLIDRQMEFARMMRENGLDVSQEFSEGGCHGIEFVDDSKAKILFELLKNFILTP